MIPSGIVNLSEPQWAVVPETHPPTPRPSILAGPGHLTTRLDLLTNGAGSRGRPHADCKAHRILSSPRLHPQIVRFLSNSAFSSR